MFVSAIMPTRGRPEMAARALDCIRGQAWPELAIHILDDSLAPSFPTGADGCYYERVAGESIGKKLNRLCCQAAGEYILRFDDDDDCAPGRIADQVNRLFDSGKAVTSYRNLRFTDGQQVWINRNWPGGYGTSLAFRRDWWERHPFCNTSDGEDWEFVSEAMRAGQYIPGDAGEHMLCRIHPGNTAPKHIGAGWERVS